MEFGHSLQCPQQPDPEPDKSSRHPHSPVPEDTFYYYSPINTYFSQVGSSPYVLQLIHLAYILCFIQTARPALKILAEGRKL